MSLRADTAAESSSPARRGSSSARSPAEGLPRPRGRRREAGGRGSQVPPKVKAAAAGGSAGAAAEPVLARADGTIREYWIRAEQVKWKIVPTGKRPDAQRRRSRARPSSPPSPTGRTRPGFAAPLGPATIPGPLLEVETGETLVGQLPEQAPDAGDHAPARDLLLAARWTAPTRASTPTPAASCRRTRPSSTSGTRPTGPRARGSTTTTGPATRSRCSRACSGRSRPQAGSAAADREFPLFFHDFIPTATGLSKSFSCVNGRAYAGNTPTLAANVGDDRRLLRLRDRQQLPHLPPARPPLDECRRAP